MTTRIAQLNHHYILCGAGRTGLDIIDRFYELDATFVVVENNTDALHHVLEYARSHQRELLYVQGDATEDETLISAGIERAKGMISALSDDKDNLFATLTARSLNPNLRIVTRVEDEKSNSEKMLKAGADRVVSSNLIGGMRIASEMIRPEVVKFLDQMLRVSEKEKTLRFTELPLHRIKIPALVKLLDASQSGGERLCIRDIGKHTGLLVVAIKSPEVEDNAPHDVFQMRKRYRFTPRGDVELHPSDILVVIGTQVQLDEVTGIHGQ